ncbi:alpha/beta hydrolase, putative [Plasmodium relictum]|uniref:Alpha/beta hydrolase, putative n=1 Tax=Plasmodium relictum TaxID=85471 RepID=A0A1J1HE89_PLARL|nr:alpha/beta hydrolase, putative [Plasmodium relictum]CRH03727.1 alpha/beta hydrolase, putative [Plasmodium relictum]
MNEKKKEKKYIEKNEQIKNNIEKSIKEEEEEEKEKIKENNKYGNFIDNNKNEEKNKDKKKKKSDKDKKESNIRIIKSKNQCYSSFTNQNIKILYRNEFINDNSFFVFPYNRNVVDLKRKGNSSIEKEKTTSFKNDGAKNDEQKYLSTFKSIIDVKKDPTISIINSSNEIRTNDYVDDYLNFESKDEIRKNEENDMLLFKYGEKQNPIISIREFESIPLKGEEENDNKVKEEKWESNNSNEEKKKLSKINKDEEEKKKIYNEIKEVKEKNDDVEEYSKKRYVEEYQNNRKKEDEKYIMYKVPRYLKKKNIRCPFVYKNVFIGKYGIINYDLKGNDSGILVITFHGLNGTNLTFLEIQNILIRYKFQVLNFDLYGHGLSACPKYNHKKRTYGIDFFLSQTEELLNHLKLQDKEFYLIGFSMGCIIAISFARKYINQVKKIILISPVGVLEKKPFLLKLLKIFPCIINISSFFMLPCFISKKKLKNNDSQNDTSDYLYNRIMWQTFVKKNITHSILGCVNNLKMWSAHEIFKEVGINHIPVLILCGENDNICNVNVFKNVSNYFSNSHLIIFKNASHLVLVEKSQKVIACVLTFFHFPNDADLKLFHYILPVDKMGNYVVKDKRFSEKYSSSKSYLEDIGYIPNIFISFIDKEQEYKFKKKKNLSLSFDVV